MGVFQVNADGGGPFTAEVSADATGTSWQTLSVTSQPPGVNGLLQCVFRFVFVVRHLAHLVSLYI